MKLPDYTFGELFSKKAFELTYAIFRLGAVMHHRSLASNLEELSVALLVGTTKGNYPDSLANLNALEHMIRLGIEVGYVNQKSGNTLFPAIEYLRTSIAEFSNSAKLPDIDLEPLFSKEYKEYVVNQPIVEAKQEIDIENIHPASYEVGNSAKEEDRDEYDDLQEHTRSAQRAEIRQAAILDKIRQIGNCRIKDLQEMLPDVSERTLRYDLQKLGEDGLIEKVGSGGPSTYYQPIYE